MAMNGVVLLFMPRPHRAGVLSVDGVVRPSLRPVYLTLSREREGVASWKLARPWHLIPFKVRRPNTCREGTAGVFYRDVNVQWSSALNYDLQAETSGWLLSFAGGVGILWRTRTTGRTACLSFVYRPGSAAYVYMQVCWVARVTWR